MSSEETLYDRIGGAPAVTAAVDGFYDRVLADVELSPFFEGVNTTKLRVHQVRFFTIAFGKIPEDLDVPGLIREKHASLFRKGLDASHFDLVAGHLVDTLKSLDVTQEMIDEVVAIVGPLRAVFEEGNEEKKEDKPLTLFDKLGGQAAVKAAVDEFYKRVVADPELETFFEGTNMALLKTHQVRFMSIAFSGIPKDMDVAGLMLTKHAALFEKGLDETHFDLVAGHLVGSLQHLEVPQNLIDDAVSIVGPLRGVFEEGAQKAKA